MTNPHEELLRNVKPERRDSTKKLLLAGTFVVPLMSSFAMKRLTLNGRALTGLAISVKGPPPP